MKARRAAAAIAIVLAFPTAGIAEDNPWKMFKEMFREPVSELKQQFKQLHVPTKAKAAPQPKAAVAGASASQTEPAGDTSPIPIPVARPETETEAASPPQLAATPPQGNSPIVVDAASSAAGSEKPVTEAASAAAVEPKTDTAGDQTETAEPDAARMSAPAEQSPELMTALAPIPRARPQTAIPYAAPDPAAPEVKSAAAIGALVGPLHSLAKPPPAARSTCGVSLARLGVEAKPIAPISEGVCGVPEPVAVAALGDGVTDLTTKAIIGCQTAEVLANWLADDVQPAAQKYLDGEVVGLRVAASYACRTRDGIPGAKLSEHARGNAIDISAFNVSGHGWVAVGGNHGLGETGFLKTIRKAACGPFKTVLGPGTDSYHTDHFHLDLARRNNRGPSRGLYCK